MGYQIEILEYAWIPNQPVGSILQGRHNAGSRMFPMTYSYLMGEGHNILIDVGMNDYMPKSLELQKRDNIINLCAPDKLLPDIGIYPKDIDTIFITHAHLDHMDALDYFPNARIYIQREEYFECKKALECDAKYNCINKAVNPENIKSLEKCLEEGRVELLDGEYMDILPGINVYPEYNGHSYASQIITVMGCDGVKYIFTGDLVYSKENFTAGKNGEYIPIGLSVGTTMSLMQAMDDIMKLADGDVNRLIIAHEPDNWTVYPTILNQWNLHRAIVCSV